MRKRKPLANRFNEKWVPEPFSECWLWTGADNGNGYGVIGAGGRGNGTLYAHRVSYELANGAIPDGLQLDHLCRTTYCVNPKHLEAVSSRENLLRGETINAKNAKKTHCPAGHPYSGDNLQLDEGSRRCRICRNKRSRNSYRKRVGLAFYE